MNGCVRAAGFDPKAARETLNRWIARRSAPRRSPRSRRRSRPTASTTRRARPTASSGTSSATGIWSSPSPCSRARTRPAKAETRATVAYVLDQICKLLHPFMPFLTEELWAIKGGGTAARELLALAPWPRLDGLADARPRPRSAGWSTSSPRSARPAPRRTCRRARRSRSCWSAPSAEVAGPARALARRHPAAGSPVGHLASPTPPRGARCNSSCAARTAALPLEGVVDLEAELARLEKEIAKARGRDRQDRRQARQSRFPARAPEEVVEEQRERRAEAEARLRKIEEALARLRGA